MLKNKPLEVNSDILYQISLKLLDCYTIEPNIYYLLLLSYLTINEFSRKQIKLDKTAKIDLCIQYIPDLIIGLGESKIIEGNLAISLKTQLLSIDLKNLFDVYHYLFISKNTKPKKSSCMLK